MLGQLFRPQRQAERRVIGTGVGRRSEYVTNPKQSVVTGSMLANSALDKQYTNSPEGGDNVVQNSAEVQRYVDGSFDVSDQEAIRAGLASLEPDTPDVILDAAMEHWQTVQGINRRPGGTRQSYVDRCLVRSCQERPQEQRQQRLLCLGH